MTSKRPPRPAGTIMLPAARLAQLHNLAALRDPPISTTELIEELIGREVEAGAIRDELPGFSICVVDHGKGYVPSFIIDDDLDFGFERMRPADALAIADVLDAVSRPGPAAGKSIGVAPRLLKIARVGRGVVLAGSLPGQRRTVTSRMARDLARQLRAAVERAKMLTTALS
ncbi:hypothetical protein [Methylobacterium sp. 88A]|uniref:hypothetical protein n=1 Tax=Methylobacterium sp. 88A TaxID=1131813 RepID=UPI00039DEB6C|nr:hypothetical protein [Methylobacterium sp. 88A]